METTLDVLADAWSDSSLDLVKIILEYIPYTQVGSKQLNGGFYHHTIVPFGDDHFVCGTSSEIQLWKLSPLEMVKSLTTEHNIAAVTQFDKTRIIFTVNWDEIFIWDTNTNKSTFFARLRCCSCFAMLVWNGRFLFTAGKEYRCKSYDVLGDLQPPWISTKHTIVIKIQRLDSERVIIAGNHGIEVYNVYSNKCETSLCPPYDCIYDFLVLSNTRIVLCSSYGIFEWDFINPQIEIKHENEEEYFDWWFDHGKAFEEYENSLVGVNAIIALAHSRIAIGNKLGQIIIYDYNKSGPDGLYQKLDVFKVFNDYIHCLASVNGRIVAGSVSGEIAVLQSY